MKQRTRSLNQMAPSATAQPCGPENPERRREGEHRGADQARPSEPLPGSFAVEQTERVELEGQRQVLGHDNG